MLDMVDMVELMQGMEDELVWNTMGSTAENHLDEDHERFSATLDQLFHAQKVEVPMSEVELEDHLDADKLMLADLTAETNTPFTTHIRSLVERFGQTILMVEDLEESIAGLEELETTVKAVEKVAPSKKKSGADKKLHHQNQMSLSGPDIHDRQDDLPSPDQVKPKLVRGSKKRMLPKVSKPTETWPEKSYATTDRAPVPVATAAVSLSDLMKSREVVAVDNTQEDEILLRLYEYVHDKMSNLQQVFREFDRDNSGAIDEEELYYALRHLGFMVDFGECRSIINALEKRAAEIEHKYHHDHSAYAAHMKGEEQLIGTLGMNTGGYYRHVDGKIEYKELVLVLNDAAKIKGVVTKSSRFTTKGQLKKRAPGESILKGAAGASKIKGVKGIQGLNSLYRTHARITGKADPNEVIDVAQLDVIGPIPPVDYLEDNEYGIVSANKEIFPVRAEAAAECKALMASHTRTVALDAPSSTVQTVAELLEGLALDGSQLHKNTVRKMQGDMLALLVVACQLENLRLFIATVDKVLEGDGVADHEIGSLQELVASSFAMDVPALEWHKKELSISGVGPAMDVFWYSRCREEFDAEDDIESCKGMWKQIYCELRFQRTLRMGVDQVSKKELALWDSFIGPLVQTVDLSETGCGDDTVAVCVEYCANIKYLDVHDTRVTDDSINRLVSHLQELVWINIEDTAITGDGVETLVQAFPSLELVG